MRCSASVHPSSPALSALPWHSAPSAEVRVRDDEIHLWSASLDDGHGALSRFYALLSPDERLRASRFHASRDRDRFVVCRGILRELLARYLRRDPSAIEFAYGRFGKPQLAEPVANDRLHFNASHSGALALYAVTSACPIGVDVERLRTIPDVEQIAARFFTPAETTGLMSLPLDERMDAFLACWTCKEAFVKATGEGIGGGLDAVQVVPGECPRVLSMVGGSSMPSEWHVQRLWPAAGYVGAIAYKHDAARLSHRPVAAKRNGIRR